MKAGEYYFCVKTKLSPDGEIYVHGDSVDFTPNGGVTFWKHFEDGKRVPTFAASNGQWIAVYVASIIDGGAIGVEHWKGEVNP